MPLNIYGYAGCTTVKKAVDWATQKGLAPDYTHFAKVADLEHLLHDWIDHAGIDALFNLSAQSFKKLEDAEQQAITASTPAKIAAMVADPRLIKRPVGTDGKTVLTGFNLIQWEKAFA